MTARRVPAGRQRGAALLAALLTVALVATLAASALWQQWRAIEVEAAERARAQAGWVLAGATDWARLILREDAKADGNADHLAEPWAIPLREARLSTFLAADRQAGTADSPTDEAFLSGEIIDLQSRLNVTNLVDAGRLSAPGIAAFQRLFQSLGLPPSQVAPMAQALLLATATRGDPQALARAPLAPQQAEDLGWLGLPPATVAALQPHVTVLPARTPVNLNTASALVIHAAVGGISLADAQRLVSARNASHFRTLADAESLLGAAGAASGDDAPASVNSRFFEVRGRLRMDRLVVQDRTLVRRDNDQVRPLLKLRSADAAAPPAAAAPPR